MTIITTALTKKNEAEFRAIFRASFPNETWRVSVPHPADTIIAAQDDAGRIQGFCFVHSETPYAFALGPGAFMYNLCVAPAHRRQGIASAIIRRVTELYPQCYSQMYIDNNYHPLMKSLGWVRIGVWRNKTYEYAYGFPMAQEIDITPTKSRLYDSEENVFYLC
jgi:ribosomal protein S18 acetylase RimI-like enzyme